MRGSFPSRPNLRALQSSPPWTRISRIHLHVIYDSCSAQYQPGSLLGTTSLHCGREPDSRKDYTSPGIGCPRRGRGGSGAGLRGTDPKFGVLLEKEASPIPLEFGIHTSEFLCQHQLSMQGRTQDSDEGLKPRLDPRTLSLQGPGHVPSLGSAPETAYPPASAAHVT